MSNDDREEQIRHVQARWQEITAKYAPGSVEGDIERAVTLGLFGEGLEVQELAAAVQLNRRQVIQWRRYFRFLTFCMERENPSRPESEASP